MIFLSALCLVWAGMVLGISFLETPVKFTAPSITLPIGLDIGRHVFSAFNKVEVSAALLAWALLFWMRPRPIIWAPLAVVVLIVAVQTVWLLPAMDARIGVILDGGTPPPASYHIVYVMLELLKLICLFVAGIACSRR